MRNGATATSAFALSLVLAGCGGHDEKSRDLSVTDLAASTGCASMTVPDDAQRVAAFEFSDLSHGYDWVDQIGSTTDGTVEGTSNVFTYQFWHSKSAADPTLPHDAALSAQDHYETCTDCVSLNVDTANPGDPSSGIFYFGQGGSITASALGHADTGTVAVAGADIRLVEWDLGTDSAVANGKCVDVATFALSAVYDDTGVDMGSFDMEP